MATKVHLVTAALLLLLRPRASAPAHFPEWPSVPDWWFGDLQSAEPVQDVQVVYLPALLPREAQQSSGAGDDVPVPYSFDAFGRSFSLKLVPNRRLVTHDFGVWSEQGRNKRLSAVDPTCHFQHAGVDAVAAFSACKDHALHGLIVVDNSTYEVRPLPAGEARAADGGRAAHVIRRAAPPSELLDDLDDVLPLRPRARPRRPRTYIHKLPPSSYTIEIALFLDEAAYTIFSPYFNYKDAELRDLLLAYINGVQALYQHWSLGTHIQLSLVRMTLLRAQPSVLTKNAERSRMLDSFCAYQRSLNVEDDEDPDHWDMALLLTGLDLYSEEGGRRNGVTMGLAPVGGVCLPAHACVIAEFGAADALGRPYPSAGFTSVYILAHEIGHNLGMHHDGAGNTCSRDGYIMSPSRGTHGEATWSPCSARVAADLQWAACLRDGDTADAGVADEDFRHERFGNAPGQVWTAKKQCEVLLRDQDAVPAAPEAVLCAQLSCRTPHRAGFYYAGPALPGTACGYHLWCQGGECVSSGGAEMSVIAPSLTSTTSRPTTTSRTTARTTTTSRTTARTNPTRSTTTSFTITRPTSTTSTYDFDFGSSSQTTVKPAGATGTNAGEGGWSAWWEGACRSGCTYHSLGFRERRRGCASGHCDGVGYDVVICDDSKVCGKKKRISVSDLAARKCAEYASALPGLDARGGGLQAPHDPTRMWMGCAVFCRRAAGGGFYAPRVELNDAGLDPYFPDGTWCHHDGHQDYYCLQHHCLPENFKMTAQFHIWELGEDIGGPFNARSYNTPPDASLQRYHSLSEDGVPLARSGFAPQLQDEPENLWEVKDYVDIPAANDTLES